MDKIGIWVALLAFVIFFFVFVTVPDLRYRQKLTKLRLRYYVADKNLAVPMVMSVLLVIYFSLNSKYNFTDWKGSLMVAGGSVGVGLYLWVLSLAASDPNDLLQLKEKIEQLKRSLLPPKGGPRSRSEVPQILTRDAIGGHALNRIQFFAATFRADPSTHFLSPSLKTC